VVVGFKMNLIMEAVADDAAFVYNGLYDQTNTSKSLLKALMLAPPGGVLWLNGDVVFVPGLLDELRPYIDSGRNFVAVNTASPGRRSSTPSAAMGWSRSCRSRWSAGSVRRSESIASPPQTVMC